MSSRNDLLCDVIDNQRRLTKWYLKKIPVELLDKRVQAGDVMLNSPLWVVAHLVWTDFGIGMLPLGYKGSPPPWVQQVAYGSSGELGPDFPDMETVMEAFNDTHEKKLDFIRSLDNDTLEAAYAHQLLGFKSNYYALLHLARHEGVHCGGLATLCKIHHIKTV